MLVLLTLTLVSLLSKTPETKKNCIYLIYIFLKTRKPELHIQFYQQVLKFFFTKAHLFYSVFVFDKDQMLKKLLLK